MVSHYYPFVFENQALPDDRERAEALGHRVREFSDFVVNVLGVKDLGASHAGRAVFHTGCHQRRELGVLNEPRDLLKGVSGLELLEWENEELCCGFGGMFSVKMPDVSTAMADEKIAALEKSGADTVISCDSSCLMHLGGRLRRMGHAWRSANAASAVAFITPSPSTARSRSWPWATAASGTRMTTAHVSSADALRSTSADGMVIGTPLDAVLDGRDAMVAVAMNGEPLPLEHGFPARMVVPGLYGYVSATKWLTDIEVTRFSDFTAYWTSRDWAEQAPVKLASRIDVPRGFQSLESGDVRVGGVAWAQNVGIRAVEVRVDDGSWEPAQLAPEDGIDTWRQWTWRWDDATSGDHTLAVRAVDADGNTQTSDRADPRPDGSTGWHSVQFSVE